MPLNLFRLNKTTCRYCQDGIEIPKRLLDIKTPDPTPSNSIISQTDLGINISADESFEEKIISELPVPNETAEQDEDSQIENKNHSQD